MIDGKNYVKRIACLSRVKGDLVKACIQNLVYYRVVQCLDGIFMYSNEYMVMPEIRLFRENKDFRKEFYRFLYYLNDEDQPVSNQSLNSAATRVPFTDIFKLITSFKKGTTCKDVIREFFPEKNMGFDLFRLVSYLNLKGILKRVHSYPVYPPNDESRFGISINGQNFEYSQEPDHTIRVGGIDVKSKSFNHELPFFYCSINIFKLLLMKNMLFYQFFRKPIVQMV